MKKIIIIIAAALFLSTPCYAESELVLDTSELERAIPDYAIEILESSNPDSYDDIEGKSQKILGALSFELKSEYKPALRRGLYLLVISLVCSIFEIFSSEKAPLYIKLCGCCAVSLVCAGGLGSYIKLGTDTLSAISEFSNALLPTLCTAGIICGTPASSAASYAASALFMDILVYVSKNIVLPLVLVYTALIIASAAFNSKALGSVCNLLKWLCISLMTLLTLTFTAYISISSAVASGGDAVASKLAKTAISGALPVVGGIISDAASALVAGAELMRSLVGVLGLFVVLAICVAPFAILGINYLILKAAAAVVGTLNSDSISALIKGFGSSLGMILALTGSAGIMTFISIISCIKAVNV